jgi:hypothetical protein
MIFFLFLQRFEFNNTAACEGFVECQSRSSGNCRSLILTFDVSTIPTDSVIDVIFVQIHHSGSGTWPRMPALTALTNTVAHATNFVTQNGGPNNIQTFTTNSISATMLFDPSFRLSFGGASVNTSGGVEVELEIDCVFMTVVFTPPTGNTITTASTTAPTTAPSSAPTTAPMPTSSTTSAPITSTTSSTTTTVSSTTMSLAGVTTTTTMQVQATIGSTFANQSPVPVDDGFPTWAIVVIVVVGAICIIGVLYFVWATRTKRQPEGGDEKHTAPGAMVTISAATPKSEYGSITQGADHYKGVATRVSTSTSPYAQLDVNEI